MSKNTDLHYSVLHRTIQYVLVSYFGGRMNYNVYRINLNEGSQVEVKKSSL